VWLVASGAFLGVASRLVRTLDEDAEGALTVFLREASGHRDEEGEPLFLRWSEK
jgi:hypothetical protein